MVRYELCSSVLSKRDTRGMHYGFIWYFDVQDEAMLANNMDNIFTKNRNIRANMLRFQRMNALRSHDNVDGFKGTKHRDMGKQVLTFKVKHKSTIGNSHADVLQDNGIHVASILVSRPKVSFQVQDEDIVIFHKAFVGVVENPDMLYNMQEYINIEGYFSIRVTPLRSNLCLLEDRMKGEMEVFLNNGRNW